MLVPSVGSAAPFEVTLGNTVLRTGQSGLVQVTLVSSLSLTQLNVGVSFPSNAFTGFSLQRLAPAVCTNWVEVVDPTNLLLRFSSCATNWIRGTQLLAVLRFTVMTNQSSAFVPLRVEESVAFTTNGTHVDVASPGTAGRVTVIGNEPLLDTRLASNGPSTTVYGITGRDYRLDMSSNLVEWNGYRTALYTGALVNLDEGAVYQGARFFRAQQLATSNNVTGDHLQTTNGDIVIHPLFHASFMMQWNGKAIYSDPDDDSAFVSRYAGLPKADLILVTHDHSDHFSSGQIESIRRTNAVLIVPQLVYNGLSTAQRALAVVLTNGVSTDVLGLTVEAVPAYNDNHPRGNGNSYVVTMGGRRIYISGDTGSTPEMRALQNIDVAFLCMNLPFTMSVSDAAAALRAFQPRVVYPYHYRNSGGTFADLNALRQMVGTDLGIEVRLRRWYN